MNLKRVITAALVGTMAISSLTGCGDKKSDKNIDPSNMSEKITITWLGVPYNPSAQEGTLPEKVLEEKFNVDIKPIFLAQNNFNDKKSMMMAGGEIPDLVYELDPINVKQDADQGLIMKLPYETIKKYAPTVYAQLNKEAPQAWLYSLVEDDNYGLPNLNFNNAYPRIGVWRTDWLKKVGINKVPETLDEMYLALSKFTNEDPDGNGKKDTYGMSGDIKNWHTMFTNIFGAYGVTPFNWMKTGDKVEYGGFQEGTKQALELLSKWYQEGLIHPDFITDDVFTTGKDKFTNGIVGFVNQHGGYFDPKNTASLLSITKQINPNAEIENCKPVTGPEGKSGTHVWGKPCHVVSFGMQVEKQPEKLARILSMFETLITDESLASKVLLGEKGTQWTYNDEQVGLDSGTKFLPPYDDSNQQKNECLSSEFGGPSYFVPLAQPYETFLKYRRKEIKDVFDKYADPKNGLSDAFMKPDTLPSSSKYFVDLRTKQINIMVQIIKGEKPLSAYKEFEDIWKAQGGPQLEKEAQDMNSQLDTIYKNVGIK